MIGSCAGTVAIPLAAIVASRWFLQRRGFVTSLMVTSNATGQLVFLPLIAAAVSLAGWRWACALIALVAVFVVLPLAALLMRNRPADVGLPPYGGERHRGDAAPLGLGLRRRLLRPRAGRALGHVLGAGRRRSSSAAPRPTA